MKKVILIYILVQIIFANTISIIATTNVNGEIDPCGWPKKPLGGLARKATYIDKLYDSNINPLILDAGNLFYKKDIIDPGITLETAKINAEVIAKSYAVIGCNAFSPGSHDFAAGLENLLWLEDKSKIKLQTL